MAAVGPRGGHGPCRESSLAHLRCTARPIERRIRFVKKPLLSFLVVLKGARCPALSEASEVENLRRDLTERANDKAEHASELQVAISASVGPVASAGVLSFASGFLAALW